ncbi:ras-related protein Rab-7L1-like [Cimex lectularius]|uniref:Ras-related protein Rab n=1 Tax=Cimex lectularius TaxID=79782 RepID=A0A8I6S3Q4_CIMLE|nr:ras-related protein Rab-7L1-like [Cimex lectularius]
MEKNTGRRSVAVKKIEAEQTADESSEPESDSHYYYTPPNYLTGSLSPRKVPEKLFKVIIIGDPTVGKTSFIQRYVRNSFSREYKSTVGVDFALKVLHWYGSQTIKLQLWDIAGQERFTWMTRVYYKNAHGCIIMFDLTNKTSFDNSLKWKKDLDSKCSLGDGSPVPCMLLANKCDLEDRRVEQLDIESFHKQHNFIGWTETSAKEGLMVNESMRFLVEVIMQHESAITASCETRYVISVAPGEKETKKCWC